MTPMKSKVFIDILFSFAFHLEIFLSLDESKLSVPITSPNLLQKLLFRQFSPKTRPYPVRLSDCSILS